MEDKLNLAWAAGLFEGEGCITIYEGPKHKGTTQIGRTRVNLVLTTTDEDIVLKFQDVVGGKIYRRPPQQEGWKPIFKWTENQKDNVRKILCEFMPYFGKRRTARAEEALEMPTKKELRYIESRRENGKKREGRSVKPTVPFSAPA
jgi:hypothetical protein